MPIPKQRWLRSTFSILLISAEIIPLSLASTKEPAPCTLIETDLCHPARVIRNTSPEMSGSTCNSSGENHRALPEPR